MIINIQQKRLGDLFIFKNGRAFKKEEWSTTGLPIIRIQNLNRDDAPFNRFTGEYSQDIVVEEGDLLFSWSGTVGSSFGSHLWSGERGLLNQHIFKIGLRDGIDKRYAFHALRHITEEIERSVNGAVGLVHITKEKLNEFVIPLPSLPEQKRIVGILDKAFEGIATAKANAEKNLQNARALFESHLHSVFTQRGEGWEERRLGELAEFRNGINFTKSSRGETVRVIGVKDFQNHFYAPLDELDVVTIDGSLPEWDLLKENDILFVRSNGNIELIGRSLLVGKIADRVTHSGFTIRARLTSGTVVAKYLCHFLKSYNTRRTMIESGIGTNIKSLNQTILSTLVVPIPTLAQQLEISNKLEAMDAETQRLADVYQRKLSTLEALKKSLLHQAFSGQL